jgi:hypothetical protein
MVSGFILGFLGSLHCVGMCGPIAFMLPVNRTHKGIQFFQVGSYHVGRLFTYSFLGLIFGLFGKGVSLFGFQQQLSVLVGILMILSIVLPRYFKKIKSRNKINQLLYKLKSALGAALKKKGNDTFFTIGFLNGFLPCGLVYMAVFGALTTNSVLQGSLYMFLFGLGTIPLMTSVVYLGNFTQTHWKRKIQKAIPILVIFMGFLFILRGLGLGIPYISPKPVVELVTATKPCY